MEIFDRRSAKPNGSMRSRWRRKYVPALIKGTKTVSEMLVGRGISQINTRRIAGGVKVFPVHVVVHKLRILRKDGIPDKALPPCVIGQVLNDVFPIHELA